MALQKGGGGTCPLCPYAGSAYGNILWSFLLLPLLVASFRVWSFIIPTMRMRICQHYFTFRYYHCILRKLYAPSLHNIILLTIYILQEHAYIHLYTQSLVLDTYKNGRWDRQELPSNFLFQRRTVTNITVYAGATGFDLYSNKGAFHYHYIYRTDVTQITKLTQHYSGTKQVSVGKVSAL